MWNTSQRIHNTVAPLNSGYFGDKHFVHCSEVVPQMYRQRVNSLSIVGRLSLLQSVHYLRFHSKLHISLYSGTSDKGPSEIGTTSLQRTLVLTLPLVYYFTSEIGTTSLQGTKLLAPKCPLSRGSTVHDNQ